MSTATDARVDTRPRCGGRKIRILVAVATAGVIAVTAIVVSIYYAVGVRPPGDELKTDQAAYGWYTSKDVGVTFTDGLNLIRVTPAARGPLRLISAKPLMDDGGSVRVVGILARVNPGMLPPDFKVGSFQQAPGFPPDAPHAAGGMPVEGLIVQPPMRGEDRWIELQIGYEVIAPGRSARRGVELVYEYEGGRHKVFIPSYVAVCAPSTAICPPEYDK
ncbi:hypothetical protein [Phytohabitans aurantiacus]|uniref:hypothetical protein n=1 Tax=Phytohabitans aurantiacus TaxID=3016789 RepID=UPI002492D073|nr:hypothetical protein [Phytohabitans aurantiacus]